jgi:hypothetical protein
LREKREGDTDKGGERRREGGGKKGEKASSQEGKI